MVFLQFQSGFLLLDFLDLLDFSGFPDFLSFRGLLVVLTIRDGAHRFEFRASFYFSDVLDVPKPLRFLAAVAFLGVLDLLGTTDLPGALGLLDALGLSPVLAAPDNRPQPTP